MLRYLTFEEVVAINKRTVDEHGGQFLPPDNLPKGEALEYLLEAVGSEMFGAPLYPTVAIKEQSTCTESFVTMSNRCTGLAVGLAFCMINKHRLKFSERELLGCILTGFQSPSKQLLYDFTIAVASGQRDLDEVRAWFTEHIQPV